jgi:hypothetical protein
VPTFDFATLFWWGLPLAAAPVVIHLINLLRHRRVPWAAMEFLLASQRKFRTQVLLRQLLLLALRTAAVLGLVVALAQPRWRQAIGGLLGRTSTSHLVLLDDSYSMGDRSATGLAETVTESADGDTRPATAFDRGKRVIERIARDLSTAAGSHELAVGLTSAMASAAPRGDAVSARPPLIVPPAAVTPSALQTVRNALADVRVSAGVDGPREAIGPATNDWMAGATAGRVLWIVSDFRMRDWGDTGPAGDVLRGLAAEGVELRFIDCGADASAANLTIERLEVVGGVPAAGVLLPVEVEVRNDSPLPAEGVVIELREDGGSRPAVALDSIPPGGSATRRFDARFTGPGGHVIEAALRPDVLPADDVRRTVVDVVERVDVLVVDGDPRGGGSDGDAFFVATALAPGAGAPTGLAPRIEPPRALGVADLARFDCVWLLDVERLDAAEVAALEAYARAGGGVVFFAGPRTRADNVNRTLFRDGEGIYPVPLAGAVDLLPTPAAATPVPDVIVEEHPVVTVLAGQRNPLVEMVRIDRFLAVERGFDEARAGVRRLLSLRTGQPLVVERSFGDGLVMAVLTTAAPAWNNWARGNPSWVVVLLEMESHLARARRRAENLTVGDPVAVRLEPGVDEIDVDFLVPPDGAVVRQSAAGGSAAGLESRLPAAAVPGVYEARWKRLDGTERTRLRAVNVDPAEGRLERVGRDRLARGLADVPFRYDRTDALDTATGSLGGTSLVVPLLLVLVGVLIIEQFVAYTAGYHPVSRRPSGA